MASEQSQRKIDHLLDDAKGAISQLDWDIVCGRAQAVLAFDLKNPNRLAFLAAAERAQGN